MMMMMITPVGGRDIPMEALVPVAAGWFESGKTLGVALDLEAGAILVSVNGTEWATAFRGGCAPGAAVGASLFPVLCGLGKVRVRCNWGADAGRPMRHSPPSAEYRAVGLQVLPAFPSPSHRPMCPARGWCLPPYLPARTHLPAHGTPRLGAWVMTWISWAGMAAGREGCHGSGRHCASGLALSGKYEKAPSTTVVGSPTSPPLLARQRRCSRSAGSIRDN